MTIKDAVSEILKKSDPEFGDEDDLNVNLYIIPKEFSFITKKIIILKNIIGY